MPTESQTILDGRVHVYRRENSRYWQCSVYLGGRNHRVSTGQERKVLALEFAEEWGLERLADDRLRRRGVITPSAEDYELDGSGPLKARLRDNRAAARRKGPTFRQAAELFVTEYRAITLGERNEGYVAQKARHLKLYLLPYFGDTPLVDITAGMIQAFRVQRVTPPVVDPPRRGDPPRRQRVWRRPARSTLHQEMVTLRQVLKTANRKGWIAALPDMSAPYKQSAKVAHRAWFAPDDYRRLYEATRERALNPKLERWRPECEELHDYVLFMANTGLRPDEASRLQHRDVTVALDEATSQRILEIEVRGKRGVGYCKSMPGAVVPYERVQKRDNPQPGDLVFGKVQRDLLNTVLTELDLKFDREGLRRTAYSLRHTYICLRLMEGADIYQIAKNCRTSVEMIEKHYAVHLKDMLDASAINIRRSKPRPSRVSASKAAVRAPSP
jgi:integrase